MFPQADARSWFAGKGGAIQETGFRNSCLQAAYFILAGRGLGLDCGPMSGFNPAKVNAEFFPDGKWKANFSCNLGYGDRKKLFPRKCLELRRNHWRTRKNWATASHRDALLKCQLTNWRKLLQGL